ncbi:MAG: hypothetical protein HY770_00655, partial [Chitinivibrionia bacterium]|nr:hypothetical protein [Chitinivibrionia bacterium]
MNRYEKELETAVQAVLEAGASHDDVDPPRAGQTAEALGEPRDGGGRPGAHAVEDDPGRRELEP